MNYDELPCLNMLEGTPEILRGLMQDLSAEDAAWKPAPDRFSVAEALAHLCNCRTEMWPAASGRNGLRASGRHPESDLRSSWKLLDANGLAACSADPTDGFS